MVKWIGPAQYEDKATKTLMMLPADYSLVQVRPNVLTLFCRPLTMKQDKSFKKYVETYAGDKKKFFEDFSVVVAKLFELGVPFKGEFPIPIPSGGFQLLTRRF